MYIQKKYLQLEKTKFSGELLNSIAVPSNMLTYRKKDNILEILPLMPKIKAPCSDSPIIRASMRPVGMILIPESGEREISKYVKINENGKVTGYLVFRRTENYAGKDEDGYRYYEWKLTKDEPEAFLIPMKIKSKDFYVSFSDIYNKENNKLLSSEEGTSECGGTYYAISLFIITQNMKKISIKLYFSKDGDSFKEERIYNVKWNNGIPSLNREDNKNYEII